MLRILTELFLVLAYPLLIVARMLNMLLGRDPLRLREPRTESYWIPRAGQSAPASYFSEASLADGQGADGFGWIAALPLRWLAGLFGGRRPQPGQKYTPLADREQGIPDEVYTLW